MVQTRSQKLRELKKRLRDLQEVKLREALARYGEAYQSSASWNENAAWELADEEVSVLRALISEIKSEIKNLQYPQVAAPSQDHESQASSQKSKK